MENISVTWRWVAGVLLAISISIAGYTWASMDGRVSANERSGVDLRASQSELHAIIDLQYRDIVRRLDRIERILDTQERTSGVSSNHGFPTAQSKK